MEPEPILLALRQVTAAILVEATLARRSYFRSLNWDDEKAQEMANDQVSQAFLAMFSKVSDTDIFQRMADRSRPRGAPINRRRESVWDQNQESLSDDLRRSFDDWDAVAR